MVQNALCLGTVKLTKVIITNYLIIFPLKSLHQQIIKTSITIIINHLPNSSIHILFMTTPFSFMNSEQGQHF